MAGDIPICPHCGVYAFVTDFGPHNCYNKEIWRSKVFSVYNEFYYDECQCLICGNKHIKSKEVKNEIK